MPDVITFDQVKKSFGNETILDGIDFELRQGEHASIFGADSSGKSVILRHIVNLFQPDSGDIRVFGKTWDSLNAEEQKKHRSRIGIAFQQGGLFDFMTVSDNLKFAMDNMCEFSDEETLTRISKYLKEVKLAGTEESFPYELSGGMKKRVAVARAMITEPELALFDEPTAGLDPVTSSIIIQMIQDMGKENKKRSMLVATSNVEVAIRFSERIIVIHEGKVIGDDSWKELLMNGCDYVKNILSVRLIGLDKEYAVRLDLPPSFIDKHWEQQPKHG